MSRTTVKVYGITWDVEYDYEAAERGKRERGSGQQLEPDHIATSDVHAIWFNGVDVFDHIKLSTIAAIEEAIVRNIEAVATS